MSDIEALFKKELPPNPSMRDVFDFCKRHNIEALAQGMIELPPPSLLREIAGKLLSGDDSHTYRSRRGEPEFLDALVHVLQKVYKTNVPQEALMATSGVTGALFASLKMANRRGVTRVGVTNPYYTYHGRHIELATGHKPVFVELDHAGDTFNIDWASLDKQLQAGMGALIVTNPGNPSGKVYSREDLLRLVEATGKHNCILILDEVYADLVWEGHTFFSPCQEQLHRHVISCRGFSKNVACQSWRIGYMISHPETIQQCLQDHDPIYISVPILQHAVATYLSQHTDDFVRHVHLSAGIMQRNLAKLGEAMQTALGWRLIRPQGSMYAMFRHSEQSDLDAVLAALKKGVGVAAGSMFFEGFPANSGFIRIHVGLSEERVDKVCQMLLSKK